MPPVGLQMAKVHVGGTHYSITPGTLHHCTSDRHACTADTESFPASCLSVSDTQVDSCGKDISPKKSSPRAAPKSPTHFARFLAHQGHHKDSGTFLGDLLMAPNRSGVVLQHVAPTRKPHDTWHDHDFGLRVGLGLWWVVATCKVDLLTPACPRRPAETGCRAVNELASC